MGNNGGTGMSWLLGQPWGNLSGGGGRFINHAAVVYTLLCLLSGLCVSGVRGVGAAKASRERGRSLATGPAASRPSPVDNLLWGLPADAGFHC